MTSREGGSPFVQKVGKEKNRRGVEEYYESTFVSKKDLF